MNLKFFTGFFVLMFLFTSIEIVAAGPFTGDHERCRTEGLIGPMVVLREWNGQWEDMTGTGIIFSQEGNMLYIENLNSFSAAILTPDVDGNNEHTIISPPPQSSVNIEGAKRVALCGGSRAPEEIPEFSLAGATILAVLSVLGIAVYSRRK